MLLCGDVTCRRFCKIPEVERKYILAQGPLERTCGHFWQMVWEQESKGVIMLNRTIEKGMVMNIHIVEQSMFF